MTSQEPILSIIIPSYNAEKYCADCLGSILRNDCRTDEYEVVIVDDGSTDASPAFIQSFCALHPHFRAVRQENAGVSAARNRGVREAKGAYLWFVDSDDYLEEHAIDFVLETIQTNPATETFIAPVKMRDENTGEEWIQTIADAKDGTLAGKEYLKERPVSVCPVQFFFKRQLFDNPWVYFPKGVRHEDEYFCRTLQYFSRSITVLDKPLYVYRQWGGSFMNSGADKSMGDMVEVYKQLKTFIDQGAAAEDRDSLYADAMSFLMGTHFWHIDSLKSDVFRSFRAQYAHYIIQEFNAHKRLLSQKDRMLGYLILHHPALFLGAMRLKRRSA